MRIEEFRQFLRTLELQDQTIDPIHILFHQLFRSDYLHFGFWPSDGTKQQVDLESLLNDFRSAQTHFVEELLSNLPQSSCRVLDVGAGLGKLSADMARCGHAVTAVTPCGYQAEWIVNRYPMIAVRRGRFQDIAHDLPPTSFDVIFFSESFRYVPIPQVFSFFNRLLAADGRVVIADWFVDATEGSRHGHDHNIKTFRAECQANGFAIVSERDVTANVLPTVKLAHDVLLEFYLPLAAFVFAKFAQKRPRLFRLSIKWIRKWMEKKVLSQLPGRCDPAVFEARYRYFFFVVDRGALASSNPRGTTPQQLS